MSIDYDLLFHRLHRGACAFQSLRAHRRQRGAAPDPSTVTEARMPESPPTSPPPAAPDPASEPRVTGSLEPQAFVAVGGRVVPIFGDVNALLGAPVAPVGQGTPLVGEPPPPAQRAAPAPEEVRPAPPSAPTISSSPLKLPAPTPPARLGLIYGGHARPPAPEPPPPTPTKPAATPTADRTAPTTDAVAVASTQEAAATLAAMFKTLAQQEAVRLENVHADNRAALAKLLQEHREELRARSEAATARAAEVLREVLAEHRTELARSAQTRAEHLNQAPQHDGPDHDLRAALLEQAKLQREANEDVADNIAQLTTIVADLGQTVGMLAVAAAQEARQSHLPTRPKFAAPPPVEPMAAATLASAPRIETAAPKTSPAAQTTTTVPVTITTPLVEARVVEAPPQRPIRLARTDEATAQARVRQFVDEDRDDDLEADMVDDRDPQRRSSLPPITELVQDFEAALARQEVRFREALERQAEDFAAAAARRAEAEAAALRAALCDAVESCGSTAAPGGGVEETSATAAAAMMKATAGVDAATMTKATAGVDAAARTVATAGVDAAARTMATAALEDLQGALQSGFDELRMALAAYQGELKDAVGAEVRLLARLRSAATPMDSAADAPPSQSEVGRRARDCMAASG